VDYKNDATIKILMIFLSLLYNPNQQMDINDIFISNFNKRLDLNA
jgi:hypothetical protein